MSMNQTTSRHGVLRLYYLAILILVLAVTVLAPGCGSDKKILGLGDTPIVISGGSIQLDLNYKAFNVENAKKYMRANESLYGGKIFDNNVDAEIDIDSALFKGDCTIILAHSTAQGSFTPVVQIESKYAENNKSITVLLTQDGFRRRGLKTINLFNPTYRIDKVTVRGGAANTTVEYVTNPTGPQRQLPLNGKLTMELYAQ